MAHGGQLLRRRPEGLLAVTGEHGGGSGLGERLRGGQPHAGAGAGDYGNAVVEVVGRVHAIARASVQPWEARCVPVKRATSSSSSSWNRWSWTL